MGREVGRGLGVGILDTLVVAQDEGPPLGGKLDSPGGLLEELERGLGDRQDLQAVDGQDWNLQGTQG